MQLFWSYKQVTQSNYYTNTNLAMDLDLQSSKNMNNLEADLKGQLRSMISCRRFSYSKQQRYEVLRNVKLVI